MNQRISNKTNLSNLDQMFLTAIGFSEKLSPISFVSDSY